MYKVLLSSVILLLASNGHSQSSTEKKLQVFFNSDSNHAVLTVRNGAIVALDGFVAECDLHSVFQQDVCVGDTLTDFQSNPCLVSLELEDAGNRFTTVRLKVLPKHRHDDVICGSDMGTLDHPIYNSMETFVGWTSESIE